MFKAFVIRALTRGCRIYFSRFPLGMGKNFVWAKIASPYLVWRHTKANITTAFGSRMMDVDTFDSVQRYIYFFGIFEPAITRYVMQALKPGETFIDIGANIGYYSLLAAKLVGDSGKVFAFEASPSIFEKLQRNLQANKITNVAAVNLAITATRGNVTVYKHDEWNLGGTTIISTVANRLPTRVECIVQGLPLVGALDEEVICQARIIKIDVEGAEWSVLRGFKNLLPRLSKETEIILELNPETLADQGVSISEFIAIFETAGFEAFVIENRYSGDFYLRKNYNELIRIRNGFDTVKSLTDLVFRRRR